MSAMSVMSVMSVMSEMSVMSVNISRTRSRKLGFFISMDRARRVLSRSILKFRIQLFFVQ